MHTWHRRCPFPPIYSAYQSDAISHAATYYGWFGPVVLVLAMAGVAGDIQRASWNSLFCLAVAGLTAILFARVQAPSVQHPLPVALMLFPAYCSGVVRTWSALPRSLRLAVPAFLALTFVNAFAPESPGPINTARSFLQGTRYPPLVFAQYTEYRRLVADLHGLGPKTRFTVLATAPELSDWLLAAFEPRLAGRIIPASGVDLRDGFDWRILTADFAVLAMPDALLLRPGSQRVISIPAEEIRSGKGIGASYRLLRGGYRLDGGYVAAIYQRTQPIPPDAVQGLAERFYAFYPDWKHDEARAGMLLASSVVSTGEGGSVAIEGTDAIVLRPGAGMPTTLTFPTGSLGAKTLSVAVRGARQETCGGGMAITLSAAGMTVPRQIMPGQDSEIVLPTPPGVATLTVSPGSGADCGEAVANFGFSPP